jgi:integrase
VAIIELEPDPATGRRRQRQRGSFDTKRKAQEALAEMVSGHWTAPARGTLEDYLTEEWLPSRSHLAAATRKQYEWAVGHLIRRLGAVKLSRLTPRMVQQLHADLPGDGLSPTSVHMVAKVLRMSLGDAVKRGVLDRSPAIVVALPRSRRAEIECWSQEQSLAFLRSKALRADRLRTLWRLALTTGLRRGELVALRWRDLDLDGERLFVRQAAVLDGYEVSFGPPKTRTAIRAVGLDRATVDELADWQVGQREQAEKLGLGEPVLVFTREEGTPIHPQTLSYMWDRVVEASGVAPISLHGTRHTHATLLLLAAVPLKVVSERLGHSSIQITADVYQHVLDHMQQGAAAKMGELLPAVP